MVTPVDNQFGDHHPHRPGCHCGREPCCRTHPLIMAGLLGGWIAAALLGGLLLGMRLLH